MKSDSDSIIVKSENRTFIVKKKELFANEIHYNFNILFVDPFTTPVIKKIDI